MNSDGYAVDEFDVPGENLRIPYGITGHGDTLYYTDWGLNAIIVVDINSFGNKAVIMKLTQNIDQPTGITYVPRVVERHPRNPCYNPQHTCSHICIPNRTWYDCACPKNSGLVIGPDYRQCLVPEKFLLIADFNRILLQTLDAYPEYTPQPVILYETSDMYANIVAVVYDSDEGYFYWSDNGRKHIARRQLYAPHSCGMECAEMQKMPLKGTIYEIDSLAIDVRNRLLVWTDYVKNTVEMLSLKPGSIFHATAASDRINPRGIALDPNSGLLFWTETGSSPALWKADFNGAHMTPIVPDMVGPTSVFFSHAKNQIIIADSKKMTVDSYDGTDFSPGNNVYLREAENIFSVISAEDGYYYTDWETNQVHYLDESGTQDDVVTGNLFRPTQLFIEDGSVLAGEGICTSSGKPGFQFFIQSTKYIVAKKIMRAALCN